MTHEGRTVSGTSDADYQVVEPKGIDLVAPPRPANAPPPIGGGNLPAALSPTALLFLYSPDEWEKFIGEVVSVLEGEYAQVRQLAGPYDGGLDVCAFLTDRRLQGEWHCYQCKHYSNDLDKNDICMEITKILSGVVLGHFVLPAKYYFVSPKGVKSSFARIMSNPDKMKQLFLDYLYKTKNREIANRYGDHLEHIRTLAGSIDFAMFGDMSSEELLSIHRRSPYHHTRFALPLPARPDVEEPPDDIAPEESLYVRKLLDVYEDELGVKVETVSALSGNLTMEQDFSRQRVRFYSAEALRVFARDKLPPRTYDQLTDEVYHGVIDALERKQGSAMDRLQSTMSAAAQLQLATTPLVVVTRVQDKQGICHQLANDGRITWRGEG